MQPADIGRPVSVSSPRGSPPTARWSPSSSPASTSRSQPLPQCGVAGAGGRLDAAVPRSRPASTATARRRGRPTGAGWRSPAGAARDRRRVRCTSSRSTGRARRCCCASAPRPSRVRRGRRTARGSRSPRGSAPAATSDGDDERARPPRRIDRLFARLDGVGWTIDRPAGVFVVPADGSTQPVQVAGGPYEHGDPVWAPDGRSLVVSAGPGGGLGPRRAHRPLRRRPRRGPARPGSSRRAGSRYALPSFSPDGTRLAGARDRSAPRPDARRGRGGRRGHRRAGGRARPPTLDRQCAPFPGARPPIWDGDRPAVRHRGPRQRARPAACRRTGRRPAGAGARRHPGRSAGSTSPAARSRSSPAPRRRCPSCSCSTRTAPSAG